jgi:hypothetical protein
VVDATLPLAATVDFEIFRAELAAALGFDIGACLGFHLGPHGCAACPVEFGAAPSRDRCLARGFERHCRIAAAFVRIAMIRIVLRRLAARPSA